jgi:hypothetical protein
VKAGAQRTAAVGVAEHGNSAVLVTLATGGELLDRRRIDLTSGLPTHPHHHQGSWAVGRYLNTPGALVMSLSDAVALIERVRAAGARGAEASLFADAAAVLGPLDIDAVLQAMGRAIGSPWQAKHKLAAAAALAATAAPPRAG